MNHPKFESLNEAFRFYFAMMEAGAEADKRDEYFVLLAFYAGAMAASFMEPEKVHAEILAFDTTESARFGLPSGFDKTPR